MLHLVWLIRGSLSLQILAEVLLTLSGRYDYDILAVVKQGLWPIFMYLCLSEGCLLVAQRPQK